MENVNSSLVDSLLEEDLSADLANLFLVDEYTVAVVPDPVPEDPTNLVSLLTTELECPVCYQPMLGHLHLPLLCPNGHPCCSSCASRVRRTCPTCRSSIARWTRCLFLERMGSYMMEMEMITKPPESPEVVGRSERQAMRRSRSARLTRAREHLDIWGRRGGEEEDSVGVEIMESVEEDGEDMPLLLGPYDLDDIAIFQDMFEAADVETVIETDTNIDAE